MQPELKISRRSALLGAGAVAAWLASPARALFDAAGRLDTPAFVDPMWTLRAAAAHDYRGIHVPPPYLGGMSQLARNLKREQEAALKA